MAAIDCGTNSIRLLDRRHQVRRRPALRDVHREMRIVRLGQGVDATGQFAPDALARTKAALADYAELLRSFEVPKVRMVATSADPRRRQSRRVLRDDGRRARRGRFRARWPR